MGHRRRSRRCCTSPRVAPGGSRASPPMAGSRKLRRREPDRVTARHRVGAGRGDVVQHRSGAPQHAAGGCGRGAAAHNRGTDADARSGPRRSFGSDGRITSFDIPERTPVTRLPPASPVPRMAACSWRSTMQRASRCSISCPRNPSRPRRRHSTSRPKPPPPPAEIRLRPRRRCRARLRHRPSSAAGRPRRKRRRRASRRPHRQPCAGDCDDDRSYGKLPYEISTSSSPGWRASSSQTSVVPTIRFRAGLGRASNRTCCGESSSPSLRRSRTGAASSRRR